MSAADDFERLLDDLVEAGIFEPSADGTLQPSESFRRRREEQREAVVAMDDQQFESTLSTYATGGDVETEAVGVETLGDAVAIHEATETIDRERSLLAALALERIEASEDAEGVPTGFVQLDGDDVETFMANHPAAMIYFWREDCDPCDGAKQSFETLLEQDNIPESFGLAAVYGPDWSEHVREAFQVTVAPTTLFCVDGRIDSRIVGNPGPEAFRLEIETVAASIE